MHGAVAGLQVQIPATYEDSARIPEKILAECGLDAAFSGAVLATLQKRLPDTQALTDINAVGDDTVLLLTINDATGEAGGAVSGEKTMAITAVLKQKGVVLDTFQSEGAGGRGGIFGQVFRGTCSILQGVATGLAKKTAKWTWSSLSMGRSSLTAHAHAPVAPTVSASVAASNADASASEGK